MVRDALDLVRRLWLRYERRISSIALVVGFTIDWLTLTRIDRFFDNLVLLSYITIACVSVLVIQFYYAPLRMRFAPDGTRRERIAGGAARIAPVVMQFAFGGLFSGFFIFYSRSATLAASWPFVLALLALLIGNEFLQRGYRRLVLQVAVLYFAFLSYAVFTVPMLVKHIGPLVFVLSVIVSLVVIWLFLRVLRWLNPLRMRRGRTARFGAVLMIAFLVSASYAANIIPPIPLSLKTARLAHQVERSGAQYTVHAEPRSIADRVTGRDVFHARSASDRVYLFSAVFAPTDLTAEIAHRWQFYDERTEKWRTQSVITFPVRGGRDGGYRGYSVVTIGREGEWRVDVETADGRLIGRQRFTYTSAESGDTVQTYRF